MASFDGWSRPDGPSFRRDPANPGPTSCLTEGRGSGSFGTGHAGGDAVDGHHVQGHVEACGTVLHNGEDASRGWRLRVEVPPSLMASVVPQGSITLHGVSLTVAHRDETSVEVALIPETLERTNLGHLQVGDPIHVETDVLCRTVVQTVRSLGLTPDLLADQSSRFGLLVFLTSFKAQK